MSLPINQPEGPVPAPVANASLAYALAAAELVALETEKTRLNGEMTALGDRVSNNQLGISKARASIAQAENVLGSAVSAEDPVGPVYATTADRNQVLITVLVGGEPKVFTASVLPLPTEFEAIPVPEPPVPAPEPEPAPVEPAPAPVVDVVVPAEPVAPAPEAPTA